MATDQLDWQLRVRDTGPGWGRFVLWSISAVLTFYMVAFCLICLDEFVLNHRLILEPMRAYTPDLIDPFCTLCMAVYWPLIQVLKALHLVP